MNPKPGRQRIWVYALLFTGCTINYVDRVALSVAAQPVATEFHASTVEMGYLFSAFLWLYLLSSIPWGYLVDRMGTRWSTALGMAFWSAATAATGLSWSFASIFAARLLMGLGEASIYPAGGRVIREWIPGGERGLATVVFNSGGYAGPAIGAAAIAAIASVFGWRAGFFVAGAAGFVWLAVWLAWFRQPEDSPFLKEAERHKILSERGETAQHGGAGLLALMRCRTTWGLFITQGCAVYTVYLFLTWMPSYLQAARHLSILRAGIFVALPYAVAVPGTMLMGRLSDWLLRGQDVQSGRRRNMVAAVLVLSSGVLFMPWVTETWLILVLFTVCLVAIASAVGLNIALQNDMLRSAADAGRANALLITGGNLVGLLAPIVTGYVIAGTGSYDGAFLIAGILLVVGLASVLTLTHRPIGVPTPALEPMEAAP